MLDTEQTSPPDDAKGFDSVLGEIETMDLAEPATEPAPVAADPAPLATDPAPDAGAATTEAAAPAEAPTTAEPAPPTAPADPTPTPKPFALKVDGAEIALDGAHEDGENIVIPKAVWHTKVKNYLADRSAVQRREAELTTQLRQSSEARGQSEQVASAMLTELRRVMALPEAESFAEWDKLRTEFPTKVLQAENKILTGQRESHVTREQQQHLEHVVETAVVPQLQEHVRRIAPEALTQLHPEVLELMNTLPEADRATVRAELEADLVEALWEAADQGLLYEKNGQMVMVGGVQIPDVTPNLQRLAQVVGRVVKQGRRALELRVSMAKVEAAAKVNATREAARRPAAPPAVTARGTDAAPVHEKKATSFDDVFDEAMKA